MTDEYMSSEVAVGVESDDGVDERIEEIIEEYVSDKLEEIEYWPDG